VLLDPGKTGESEGCGVVREPVDAEPGEDAEDEVEAADEQARGETHRAAGDAEVGDEPEGAGCEPERCFGDEFFELRLGEAVEEEVGDDKVVSRGRGDGEIAEGICVAGLQAEAGVSGRLFAAATEESEHGGAAVDGIRGECAVLGKERGEEAAVAVAKDEGAGAAGEAGKEVKTAVFESAAEGEVFEPAVGAGDTVEAKGVCQLSVLRASILEAQKEERGEEAEVGGGSECGAREAPAVAVEQQEQGGGHGAGERDRRAGMAGEADS